MLHVERLINRPLLAALLCLLALSARAETIPQDPPDTLPPLLIVQDHAWAPLAFRDRHGEPRGLLVDLWRAVGEHLGREVAFVLVDWQATLVQVRDNDDRVHGGLFRSPERSEYLDFSHPLMNLRTTLFVSRTAVGPQVMVAQDLRDTPVGITAGGYEEEFMRNRHPDITLALYDNNEALAWAAASGEVDAFVADYPVGMYYLDRFTTPDQFHVLEVLYQQPLHAAVTKGNQELLEEINRGLALVSTEEMTAITQKWMQSERVEVIPPWLLPALILMTLIMVLGGLLLHNRSLKQRLEQQAQELQRQARHQQLLTDNMTDFIWTVSADNKLSYVSPSVEKMLGYKAQELIGGEMTIALTEKAAEETYALQSRLVAAAQRGEYPEGYVDTVAELAQRHKDGHVIWTEVVIRAFFTVEGDFAGAQGASRDISQRIKAEETLRQMACIDPLTQLPNRRRLLEFVQQAIADSRKSGRYWALLYLDLDNFKRFNDYHGHNAGDQLLVLIARRLENSLPDNCALARYSGDGFMIVATGLGDLADARQRAGALGKHVLQQMGEGFELQGTPVNLGSSIGIALCGPKHTQPDNQFKRANQAMHQAKTQGRNQYFVCDGEVS